MPTVFLTGFPGFLGSELLPRIIDRHAPDVTVTCLIQSKFAALAKQRLSELECQHSNISGRVTLIEGDITQPTMGLAGHPELKKDTIEIFHLAAVYDLSVARDLAMRVNVDGTRHMLDFAEGCPKLKRFQHISTCYVSGTTPGLFRETDLDRGQVFNNYYEETKYLSEVDVQKKMKGGMPGTVYRPAIVVGDSRTGATQKYDGPYFVMQWLLRQPVVAVLPVIGDPNAAEVNVVPRDFVTDAIATLSGMEKSNGKVYQLCDPHPLSVGRLIDVIAQATNRHVIRIPLPHMVGKLAIDHVPGVYRLMRIPSAALEYFVLPTRFTCDNTLADLAGTRTRCPSFAEYVSVLANFMRAHPDISSGPMV